MGKQRDARNFKRLPRRQKIPITVGSFFNNTFEKNHSTSALQQISKKFTTFSQRPYYDVAPTLRQLCEESKMWTIYGRTVIFP